MIYDVYSTYPNNLQLTFIFLIGDTILFFHISDFVNITKFLLIWEYVFKKRKMKYFHLTMNDILIGYTYFELIQICWG